MKVDLRHDVEVSLQGNIAAFELNNIFQFLDYSRASGELCIFTEQNSAHFFFRQGMLIFGTLAVNQKKIGDLLIEHKLISSAQLSGCLDIHREHRKRRRLGEILLRAGFLQFDSLAEMLKIQAKEAFFATLSWKKGMFVFYSEQYPAKEEILINERIDHLILEGIVRIDESL
jgi:hypothetical protein